MKRLYIFIFVTSLFIFFETECQNDTIFINSVNFCDVSPSIEYAIYNDSVRITFTKKIYSYERKSFMFTEIDTVIFNPDISIRLKDIIRTFFIEKSTKIIESSQKRGYIQTDGGFILVKYDNTINTIQYEDEEFLYTINETVKNWIEDLCILTANVTFP
ncbi:MAG: hypothetical protein IJV31_06665 [Clostridia bacterium]|nr:hypothetical protein [Clostridia bacterium]MBR1718177.1 hypothetical protein [Bacilli bacterium]